MPTLVNSLIEKHLAVGLGGSVDTVLARRAGNPGLNPGLDNNFFSLKLASAKIKFSWFITSLRSSIFTVLLGNLGELSLSLLYRNSEMSAGD